MTLTRPLFSRCNILLLVIIFSASVAAYAKEGFGRFGRYNDDGLLTLNIWPDHFNFSQMFSTFEVYFANSGVTATVTAIDTSHKMLSLSGADASSPDEVHYTLLYPGFEMNFGVKDSAILRINTENLTMDEAPADADFHWVLLRPITGSVNPIALAFRSGLRPTAALVKSGGTSELRISGTDLGWVRVITPRGRKLFYTYESAQTLRNETADWAARGVPVLISRQYAYSKSAQTVSITEVFQSREGTHMAPVPPVLVFAMQNGYPASIEQALIHSNCTTKYGPFAYVNGNTVTYTLPVPPLEEHGYLRVPGYENRVLQLNNLVSHMPAEWNQNAVDLAYAGVCNAQMAWPYLSAANRTRVAKAWRDYLWKAWMIPINGQYNPSYTGPRAWKEETEPFTGQKYLWTYKIDGPAPDYYPLDIEWGIMLPLYGTYKYAQFTGDWQFVRDRWWEVRGHIYRFMDLADDWAWMTNTNGDMGYSTGTGDPMTAAWCGHAACLKMARALGRNDDEEYFAFRTARVAIPAVARLWYSQWARNVIYEISPTSAALGFYEKRSIVSGNMNQNTSDPWPPTTNLSGDGILPEMFHAFMAYAPDALRTFHQEYETAYPDWADAAHSYPFQTTYSGNSVYVTFPHIYSRAQLGDDSDDDLWGYVDLAYETASSAYFVGPNVIAELLNRESPLILTEWKPAAYVDGYINTADGLKAVMDFTLPLTATEWVLEGRVQGGRAPVRAILNNEQVAIEWNPDTGMMHLSVTAGDAVHVEIEFGESSGIHAWHLY